MELKNLSPKQVADAIGVSESSLKRWCDSGKIRFSKTLGGHRRIDPVDAIDFVIRSKSRSLVKPTVLGLPDISLEPERSLEEISTAFEEALRKADEKACRQTIVAAYVNGQKLSSIVDCVIGKPLKNIGISWACNRLEIYQERVACEICVRLIHELRSLQPTATEESPLAIGGTSSGDHYTLPTQVVELQFAHMGWRTRSLGCNLPFNELIKAVFEFRPKLFWLSVSHFDDENVFINEMKQFAEQLPRDLVFVVGGSGLNDNIRSSINNAIFCENMQQLETYISSISVR